MNKQHFYRNSSPVCSKFINESNVKSLKYTLWPPTCTDSLQNRNTFIRIKNT